jgi:hypothetical protein
MCKKLELIKEKKKLVEKISGSSYLSQEQALEIIRRISEINSELKNKSVGALKC